MLRFAAPYWLALGIPLVALLAFRLRRLPRGHVGARRRAIQATMLLAALFAALAFARLEWGTPIDRLATIFVLDRSRSVDGGPATRDVDAIQRALQSMRDDDLAGLVVFGAEASTVALPQRSPPLDPSTASIARDGTDIDAALRRALADLPGDAAPRIVLISDGLETSGDALDAAQVASGRSVPIDTLAIERAPSAEVAVERVLVPASSEPDEPVEVRIVTRATHAARVRVRVLRDGIPLGETTTDLRAGTDSLSLRDRPHDPGVHRYDVQIEPASSGADTALENNAGSAFLRIAGESRALVLSDRPDESDALATAVRRTGMSVDVRDRTGIPLTLAEFAAYDLVILSDLNARALDEGQMEALRSYVRDLGGGLLMLGGRDAFGLGGYARTPIEEVLPATFDLRQRRDRASLAMVIAIDKSGSMTVDVSPGVTKLDVANEAAARSAALLSPNDHLAVEHVDEAITWTLPMVPVDDPALLGAVIRRAQPGGGGIFVDVALQGAYAQLRADSSQLKHLLLFSDGSDSEQLGGTRALVTAAASDGITTSIVSMGRGPDSPELEVLSRLGGGRFYIVEDMRELPRIFTQETITASRSALVEAAIAPSVGSSSDITRGIDFGGAPALAGYVVVNARPRASVLLGAHRETPDSEHPTDDPLLLVWQAGVGSAACFTTDGGGRFASSWLAWPGYAPLFGQLARALARAPERHDAELHVAIEQGRGALRVDAIDANGRFRNHLDLLATVAGPGGTSQQVPLTQTGPGRYEAAFDGAAPGSYLALVRELADDGTGSVVGSAGVVRGRGDELRGDGTNHALLAQIAAASGGEVLTSLDGFFARRPPRTFAYAPLWRPLVLAAMWLLLASVALRRLILPEALRAWLARLTRRRTRATSSAQAHAPTTALETLRAKRAERRAPRPGDDAPRSEAPAPPPVGSPTTVASEPPPPDGSPPTPRAPSAPGSLAESLLERRKRKR